VQRRYRLTAQDRFQQVRSEGRSFKHRLAVLICLRNDLSFSRFGFSASRRVGNAVRRNRARRLLREAIRLQRQRIAPGWDVVMIARFPITGARFAEVDAACRLLLSQAGLLAATPATPPRSEG